MKQRLIIIGISIGLLAGVGILATVYLLPSVAKTPQTLPMATSPESRNELRKIYLKRLSGALTAYIADHQKLPIKLSTTPTPICSSISANCTKAKLVDLNFLSSSGTYLTSIPNDPVGVYNPYSTGFVISKDNKTGKILLSAPNAELGAVISASTN